jgi:pseudoazurin
MRPDSFEPTRHARLKTLAALGAAAAVFAALPFEARAADHVVNMLNTGAGGQTMVFEPAFVRVAVGYTVIFKPTQVGAHYAATVLVPDGAKPFRGEVDKEHRVKIEREGLYLYVCEPHKPMGMVGVIQAGKPVNLAKAREVAAREEAGFAMNKDRFTKALAQAK